MSENKHTPGPWVATTTPAGKGKVTDSNGFSIANTTAGPYLEQRTNARLIAAAPEMLEALEKAAPYIPGNACDAKAALNKPVSECYILPMVQDAIAKAKGGDQ